ncbi:TPA: glycosyltransferase, partial [Enterobacter hormaechei]
MNKNKVIKDIVVLSTADWDNPFWTNKQHVALELANRGHRVLYIESLGLRRPSVNKKDLSRIFRRVLKAIKAPRKVR